MTKALGLALATWLGLTPGAQAAQKPWSIEYYSSTEATTNLQQQADGVSDLVLRNSLELSYYPASDSDNSALFRLQALNSRYLFNPEYNATFLIGTALASRRLVNSTFGYGGYQLLYKQSDTPSNITRADNVLFGGAVTYKALAPHRLLFHGYQYDLLRAAVAEASYQGHSAYVTWREQHALPWSSSLSLRSQLRLYDVLGAMEWRNLGIAETTYRVNDWFSARGEVIYLHSIGSRPELSFTGWNYGLFAQFRI